MPLALRVQHGPSAIAFSPHVDSLPTQDGQGEVFLSIPLSPAIRCADRSDMVAGSKGNLEEGVC